VGLSHILSNLATSKFSKVSKNVRVKKREGFVPVLMSRCAGSPSLADRAIFPEQQALRNAPDVTFCSIAVASSDADFHLPERDVVDLDLRALLVGTCHLDCDLQRGHQV
jgi:hypothetical protein